MPRIQEILEPYFTLFKAKTSCVIFLFKTTPWHLFVDEKNILANLMARS